MDQVLRSLVRLLVVFLFFNSNKVRLEIREFSAQVLLSSLNFGLVSLGEQKHKNVVFSSLSLPFGNHNLAAKETLCVDFRAKQRFMIRALLQVKAIPFTHTLILQPTNGCGMSLCYLFESEKMYRPWVGLVVKLVVVFPNF